MLYDSRNVSFPYQKKHSDFIVAMMIWMFPHLHSLKKKRIDYMIHNSCVVNPLTPISDQDRISPYNINAISNR